MIEQNLFSLSKDEEESSKNIYNGKIIKCLIAPFHTYNDLENMIPYSKNTFVLPEREIPLNQQSQFISMCVSNPNYDEINIVTASQNIIIDMIDSSVRILTQGGDIVPCPIKTFMANIHDIRYSIFENEKFQADKKNQKSSEIVNDLITRINNHIKNGITNDEYVELAHRIKLIGEKIISTKLMDMLNETKLIK